jgi:putative membrane protein
MIAKPLPRTQHWLLLLTGVGALASLINSPYPQLAPLQNLPTLAFLAALWLALWRWPLPSAAIACLCAFLLLHTLGGRYIYTFVPYDHWFAAIGLPTPREVFGLQRNAYDRLVHFSFGLLLTYPFATALRLHIGVRAAIASYVAVEFVLATSALYEIFEWGLTLMMAGADAEAYNGQQGDMWDAQKDMACAGVGALLTAALGWWRAR